MRQDGAASAARIIRFQATPERSRPLTENAESPGEEINTEASIVRGTTPNTGIIFQEAHSDCDHTATPQKKKGAAKLLPNSRLSGPIS